MAKYDVYGIGSALVDIEFEVTADELSELNIDKGVMTLVDEEKQNSIIDHIHGKRHQKTCGGSAANTVFAVRQFGGRSFYSFRVANDDYGKFFVQELNNQGVDCSLQEESSFSGHTGKCICFVTPDADRTMNTFLGVSETLCKDDLSETCMQASRYVYIEGYLVAFQSGKEASIVANQMAKKNGTLSSLTFSDPNMVRFFRKELDEIIGQGMDLIFCNEAEALEYGKTSDLKEAAQYLEQRANTFVITMGGKGALVYDGKAYHEIGAYQTDVVDTTGAGDMFAGAYLYALTNGHDVPSAAKFACYSASRIVSKFGARLSQEEVIDIQSNVGDILRAAS